MPRTVPRVPGTTRAAQCSASEVKSEMQEVDTKDSHILPPLIVNRPKSPPKFSFHTINRKGFIPSLHVPIPPLVGQGVSVSLSRNSFEQYLGTSVLCVAVCQMRGLSRGQKTGTCPCCSLDVTQCWSSCSHLQSTTNNILIPVPPPQFLHKCGPCEIFALCCHQNDTPY